MRTLQSMFFAWQIRILRWNETFNVKLHKACPVFPMDDSWTSRIENCLRFISFGVSKHSKEMGSNWNQLSVEWRLIKYKSQIIVNFVKSRFQESLKPENFWIDCEIFHKVT